MSAGRVIVVGGGVAGVAAALSCRDAGFEVILVESRSRLGGATYSFRRGDLTVDTGQHVFLRCYESYTALLRRLGVLDRVRVQPRFRVPVLAPDRSGWLLRRTRLSPPAHLLPILMGHRALNPRERVAAARTALALRRLDPADPALDATSFGRWLRDRGEPERTVEVLWGLLCVAALNTEPDQASLAMAVKVFRTGMLDTVTGGDIGVPRVPLEQLHAEPAHRALVSAGVEVRLRSRVVDVHTGPTGPSARLRDGTSPNSEVEELGADSVVVAVPHHAAARILDTATVPEASSWQRLESSPIVNVHVHFDRAVTDLDMAAVVDSPVQWVFDRTEAAGAAHGQYLVISLSAAGSLITARSKELRDLFLPALRRLYPGARHARVLDFFVTREPNATFRPTPGSGALRPPARTGTAGVVLAGAWTDTGWPDTLEGAVRSGETAAEVVTSSTDSERREAWR